MHQISVIFFNIVYFSHGWRGLFDDNNDNLRSRSAIEAHRSRSASWKRSMPPLSPLTHEVRGDPVKARAVREAIVRPKEDKNPLERQGNKTYPLSAAGS